MYRVIPSQVQNSPLLFIDFYKVSVNPNCRYLKDSLECSFIIRYVGHSQLVPFTDLLSVMFYLIIQVTGEDTEQCCPQYWLLM